MEDCLDICMHKLGDGGASSSWDGLLRGMKTLGARYKTATLIRELRARVAELGDRHIKLVTLLPELPRVVRVDPRLQALYADAASLQGIDGPRHRLVELLQDGIPQLKVVPIVGFGGVGKTTLAKQVHSAIMADYDCTAFVSVSRHPDLAKILSDIIIQIRWRSYADGEKELIDDIREHLQNKRLASPLSAVGEKELIDNIRNYLQNKRYLIVIDDIWTIDAWNSIKCCFVANNCGSRVITTTRIEDIAKSCCSSIHDYLYRMKPLNDLDSRILFHRRIFHSEDACPEHLKCISDEILNKCGGLPLAILTIGSILASHVDEAVSSMEIWERILNSFHFYLERNPALEWLRHVLNLGYNSLSLELKTCMLYLGIFPEDYKIVKNDLLRRWIAEGFVTEKHGELQEDIAECYFNELINRNMIQIAEFDDCGEVSCCQVHDLMLEYIILKSTEENFVTIINDKHITNGHLNVRRLSLHPRNSESNEVLGNMGLTQARSFNLWGPAECLPCLTKFQLLRVLHLDIYGWVRKYDMSCICSLFQLRYLRTRGFFCKNLFTQLRKLGQLKTLEVVSEGGHTSYLLDAPMLPSTLNHLILRGSTVKLGGRVGHLRDLNTLCEFKVNLQDVGGMMDLGELTSLRELELLGSYGVGGTCDVLLTSLCRLSRLRSLKVRGDLGEEDVLARWSPPPRHLRRLHVLECLFSIVPSGWITQLNNLGSLEIQVRSLPSGGADILAGLTLLVHLRLHVRECVPREGVVVFRRAAFANLREFWFRWEAPCLAFEAGTMPRLRSLTIDCYQQGARQTDGVLDGVEHLGSLAEFKVNIYERSDFDSSGLMECSAEVDSEDDFMFMSAEVKRPRVEEQLRWDGRNLEAALKEAISKHPGTLRVFIKTV